MRIMMKRISIISLLVFFLLAASCEEFLSADLSDQANIEEVFSKSETTHRYLSHLYSYLPLEEDVVGSNGWVVGRSDQSLFSWYQYVYYILYRTGNYSSSTMKGSPITYFDYWRANYQGIQQCSVFMDHVDMDTEDTEDVRSYMKAEARFLRAYLYTLLFRQYGPVYIWGDRQSDQEVVASTIDRNTVDENIDFIVSELDKCIEALPVSLSETTENAGTWQGRVTKGAAMALKSRILLTAASPLFNGCELYMGQMRNMNGAYLFPQSPDPQKWERAAKAAKDLIDLNLYSLCKSTATGDAFKDGAASYQMVYFEPWNCETIFGWWKRTSNAYWSDAYSYMGGAGQALGTSVPKNFGYYAYSGICPSLKLVDSYAMWESGRYPVTAYEKDSYGNDYTRPIVDSRSGYKPSGWTENYKQPVDADWAPAFKAHNSCVGREPRYYAHLVPNGFYWPNKNNQDISAHPQRKGGRYTTYNSDECSSPYNITQGQYCRVGYAWRKNYKADTPLETQTDFESLKAVYPEIRLAEVYLNYAEACNEKPDRDEASAIEYLNKVRNRSGLKNVEAAYPEVRGNQELLRWIIQRERMIEFAMEPMRHYDACRWMIAKEEYPADNWTLQCSARTYEDSYKRVNDEFVGSPASFEDRDYLYPISARWLSEMVNLTQNYGF